MLQTILPRVYTCLGPEVKGYRYPRRSPTIVESSTSLTGPATILTNLPVKEYHFCFPTFTWSALFISIISELVTPILHITGHPRREGQKVGFRRDIFAEPLNVGKLEDFWIKVQYATYLFNASEPAGWKFRSQLFPKGTLG
jgi:hypothetical protein